VRRLFLILLLLAGSLAVAQSNSFRVKLPNEKGKEVKATLTFNDQAKDVEVRPAKRSPITIPYNAIEKASYEFTSKRKLELAPEKAHWLEIDYRDGDSRKTLVVQMRKHDAVPIQDALKAHTGIDAEVLGNADKRHGSVFGKH